MRLSRVQLLFIGGAVALLFLLAGWLFIVDVGASEPGPVDFDDTVQVGITDEDRLALPDDVVLPKVQTAYANYRYVVGYYSIERAAYDLTDDGAQQQLGHPLSVYVTDYSFAEVSLDEDGFPRTENPPRWRPADELYYVVDSDARSPTGPAIMPFAEYASASAFVEEYGGEIIDWSDMLDRSHDVEPPRPTRDGVQAQHAEADELVQRAEDHLDRPVSVTVGGEADSIQAAIEMADNHTTIVVPPGIYEERVTVDRPVTLYGPGATLDGSGEGTVIRIEADDVAIAGFEIVGTGDQLRDPDAAADDPDEWDTNIELGYGHGDAGVAAVRAENVSIVDISIESQANGILLRDAPNVVVSSVHIDGVDPWREGFMGVMSMRSPGVIQGSSITDGRDSVYLHRSHETVIRDNRLDDGRFGVHIMHTSGTVMANNTVRGHDLAGIMLMTDPEANAIVGNDIRDSTQGIVTVGTANLIRDNVVVDNDYGLRMSDHDSHYEGNVVYDNEIGVRVAGFLPTNSVTMNDFIANQQQVDIGFGPLEVWTHGGVGNYWGFDTNAGKSSYLTGSYAPAHPVDKRLDRVDGALTLANSPGLAAVDAFQDSIPGLRQGVVDTAPLPTPANPDLVERAKAGDTTQVVGVP